MWPCVNSIMSVTITVAVPFFTNLQILFVVLAISSDGAPNRADALLNGNNNMENDLCVDCHSPAACFLQCWAIKLSWDVVWGNETLSRAEGFLRAEWREDRRREGCMIGWWGADAGKSLLSKLKECRSGLMKSGVQTGFKHLITTNRPETERHCPYHDLRVDTAAGVFPGGEDNEKWEIF